MIEIYKITQDLVATLTPVITNVYPMVAPQGTTLPFVTYTHSGLEVEGSKDGEYGMDVYFQLNVISVGYTDGLQYVDAIRAALQKMHGNYNYEVTTTGLSEEAYDDGYVQHLNLNIHASR